MKPLVVTDHAVVRWLERKHGVDIEAVRDEIRAAVGHLSAGFSAQAVRVDGMRLVIRHGTVTTAIRPQHRRRFKLNGDGG